MAELDLFLDSVPYNVHKSIRSGSIADWGCKIPGLMFGIQSQGARRKEAQGRCRGTSLIRNHQPL